MNLHCLGLERVFGNKTLQETLTGLMFTGSNRSDPVAS